MRNRRYSKRQRKAKRKKIIVVTVTAVVVALIAAALILFLPKPLLTSENADVHSVSMNGNEIAADKQLIYSVLKDAKASLSLKTQSSYQMADYPLEISVNDNGKPIHILFGKDVHYYEAGGSFIRYIQNGDAVYSRILEIIGNSEEAQQQAFSAVQIEPAPLLQPEYGETDAGAQTAAAGANDFAFRLTSELVSETGEKNFVCSPYSVWMPLAALTNATDEEHKPELLEALGSAGITEEDLNRAASRMLYQLTQEGMKKTAEEYGEPFHDPMKIANALFVSNSTTVKREFAQIFADYYRGEVMSVDFTSPLAVDAVNAWAREHTEGLIDNVVEEFSPQTVAAIANAIYFSDRWNWEFDEAQTTEDVFYAPDGELTAHYMLREGDELSYYEDDKIQAMPLNFKTDACMYVLLPKDGDAVGLLQELDSAYFDKICAGMNDRTGKLLLPRFTVAGDTYNLNQSVIKLGVPLFNEAEAPLTGGLVESDLPVWIGQAVQKAMIRVDEKGTTAAAVTVMEEPGAAAPIEPEPTEPFEMICNKPFVFVLCGDTYDGGNQVLFTGMVYQPEE